MSMDEVRKDMEIPKTSGIVDRITKDPWKYRSKHMKCVTCIWFVHKESETPTMVGRCRRHAPTMSGYPVVFDTDWCGDHKVDENKV